MTLVQIIFYIALINIVFGFFVLGENFRSIRHLAFAALCFGIGIWAYGFYDIQTERVFYWPDKILLFGGILLVSGLFLFTTVFPNRMYVKNGSAFSMRKYVLAFLPVLLLLILLPFNLFITGVRFDNNDFDPIQGPLFFLYALVCGIMILVSFYNMYWQFKHSLGHQRHKIIYVLAGAGVFIFCALLFDLFLPALNFSKLKMIGPIASLFFISFGAYSLITYNLLDIRLVLSKIVVNILSAFGAVSFFIFERQTLNWHHRDGVIIEFLLALIIFNLIRQTLTFIYERFWLREYLDFSKAIQVLNMALLNETDVLKIIWAANLNFKAGLDLHWVYYFDAKKRKPIFGPSGLPEDFQKLRGKIQDQELNEFAGNLLEPHFLAGNEFACYPNLREAPIAILPIIESQILQGYFVLGPQKTFYGLNSEQVRKIKSTWAHIQTAYAKAMLYANLENRVKSQVADLTYKSQKLQQLFESRLDFVQMASHQLRSPITALSGSLQILRKSAEADKSETGLNFDLLKIAEEQAHKLKQIATGVLNLAKLQKTQREQLKDAVDLNKIFSSILPVISASFADKNLDLDYQPGNDLRVVGDGLYLEQAFFNLLENAAAQADQIKIYFHLDGRCLVTCIEDNGPGISPELMPMIFKKHIRSSSSKGAGLGLYIVKAIINAHPRGHVWFQTNPTGTIFFVRLLRVLL